MKLLENRERKTLKNRVESPIRDVYELEYEKKGKVSFLTIPWKSMEIVRKLRYRHEQGTWELRFIAPVDRRPTNESYEK